jgi:hypothetical protein
MRIIGMTDEGAAKQRGIQEAGFRRDVGAAHAAMGTDSGYDLLKLLALKVAAAIQQVALGRGCAVETILADIREALFAPDTAA